MHIFRPFRTSMHSLQMISGKVLMKLRPQDIYSKTICSKKNLVEKVEKVDIKEQEDNPKTICTSSDLVASPDSIFLSFLFPCQ